MTYLIALCSVLKSLQRTFPAGAKLYVALAATVGDARRFLCAKLSLPVCVQRANVCDTLSRRE